MDLFFLEICKNSLHFTDESLLSVTYNADTFVHSVIRLFILLHSCSPPPETGKVGGMDRNSIRSVSLVVR